MDFRGVRRLKQVLCLKIPLLFLGSPCHGRKENIFCDKVNFLETDMEEQTVKLPDNPNQINFMDDDHSENIDPLANILEPNRSELEEVTKFHIGAFLTNC